MNRPIRLEDFDRMVQPGAAATLAPSLHAQGRYLAYLRLRDDADMLDLRLLDRSTGTDTLLLPGAEVEARRGTMSFDETLARERARERCGGVTNARWLPRSAVLLSVAGKRMLLVNAETGAIIDYEIGRASCRESVESTVVAGLVQLECTAIPTATSRTADADA